MTPAEQAAAVYELEPCARTFREDVEAHMLRGYVVSTPEMFVLFRPVNWMNGTAAIVDPWFVHEECDTWHIYLYAGCLAALHSLPPYHLPWASYERKNVLRRAPVKRLAALANVIKKSIDEREFHQERQTPCKAKRMVDHTGATT